MIDNPVEIIKILKDENRSSLTLLKNLIGFLSRILKHQDQNKMTSKLLAEEICPIISTETKTINISLLALLIEHPEYVPKKIQNDYGDSIPDLHFAEEILFTSTEPVHYVGDNGLTVGTTYITNYRIIFAKRPTSHGIDRIFEIPLGGILSIEILDKKQQKNTMTYEIKLISKNNRRLEFSFTSLSDYQQAKQILTLFRIPQPLNQLFAFQLGLYSEQEIFAESLTQPDAEFLRLGIEIPNRWKFVQIPLAKKYPRNILVPTSLENSGQELITRVSKSYTNGSIPTIIYSNICTNGCILRSGSTIANLLTFSSSINLRMTVTHSSPSLDQKKSISEQYVKERILFLKTLTEILPGGSFETISCQIIDQLKPNQVRLKHSFQESKELLKTLYSSILDDHDSPTTKLSIHQWLSSISQLLSSSSYLAMKVYKGSAVLVEDDHEVSFILISLAMIMLDPYYRTILGFQVLIEHVWIRFNFPFLSASGFGCISIDNTEIIEPFQISSFIQFIDCVWQLYAQYQSCFQYNEYFLLEVLDGTCSGRYGTFLSDNEKDAVFNLQVTVSLWTEIQKNKTIYLNPIYNMENDKSPLIPDSNIKSVTFWTGYYFRWLSIDGFHQALRIMKEYDSKQQTLLDLSHSLLTLLPQSITISESVSEINLSSNLFCTVPIQVLSLKNIHSLDISNNMIQHISKDLIIALSSFKNLENVNFSDNKITFIDSCIDHLTSIHSLHIGGNGTFSCSLPSSLFKMVNILNLSIEGFKLIEQPNNLQNLQNLNQLSFAQNCLNSFEMNSSIIQTLNLKYNQITNTSLKINSCINLTNIDLSHNRLDSIPECIFKKEKLIRLNLSNNQITRISPYLSQCKNLQFLDISNNQLTEISPIIGSLLSLQQFKFESNKITYPDKNILSQSTPGLLHDLRKIISKQISFRRCRLMIVGQENVGKSSISYTLRSGNPSNSNLSTDGIFISPWNMEINKNNAKVDIEIWDFAGQEIYYTTHQLFLSDQAIYLVVWNILDNEEFTRLSYWLESIKLLANSAPTILVATHVDQESRDKSHKILQNIAKKYCEKFPFIKGITAVSCTTCIGIPELKERISETLSSQSFINNVNVQCKLKFFEKHLLYERTKRHPPILSYNEYKNLANHFSISEENNELDEFSKLLNSWGTILYYTEDHLKDIIVIDPKWLIQVLSDIITTKHRYIKQGILEHSDLIHIWSVKDGYPLHIHSTLLQILLKFEILFFIDNYDMNDENSWRKGKSIIPSALPHRPDIRVSQIFPKFESNIRQYMRIYHISFVPPGFLNHLIIRLIEQLIDVTYWRNGVAGFCPNEIGTKLLVELLPSQNLLRIIARGNKCMKLFLKGTNIVESFIDNWLKDVNIKITVPCPHCYQEKSPNLYSFPFETCKEAALYGEVYIDCLSGSSVRLDMLVPDLSMADVPRFKYSDVQIEKEIGKGGFATVYKAEYNHKIVALKKLDIGIETSIDDIFSDFIHETWIMNGIQHPNIIEFIGLCTSPLCIMTDFAAYGNLYDFLHDDKYKSLASSWPLKLRIAYDIAEGMRFLHNRIPPIIHSDLKSPNILLLSVNATDNIVAVVADFGLSKSWVPELQGRNVDNPVWLAPEILSGKKYSERADVYAFGVILYEIITLEAFFSEYSFLSAMEDAIISGKRPEISQEKYSNSTNIISLIESCWQNDPDKRPTFSDITHSLEQIILISTSKEEISYFSYESDTNPFRKFSSCDTKLYQQLDPAFVESFALRESTFTNHCILTNHGSLWCAESDGSISIWDVDDHYCLEKSLPFYYSQITCMIFITSENTIWTTSSNSQYISIWCSFSCRLLRLIPCHYSVLCFCELENTVCAGTDCGLLLLWTKQGQPSRYENICPPFIPQGLSSGVSTIFKKMYDEKTKLEIQNKKSINRMVTLYQFITRNEFRIWLEQQSNINDECDLDAMLNVMTTQNLIQNIFGKNQQSNASITINTTQQKQQPPPVTPRKDSSVSKRKNTLLLSTSSEKNLPLPTVQIDDDIFVLRENIFGGIEIVSTNHGNEKISAFKFNDESLCSEISCLYFDQKEEILWIGGSKGGVILLNLRCFSIIAFLHINSPIYQFLRVRNTIWICSDRIYVFDKFTLRFIKLEGHEGFVQNAVLLNDFVWTSGSDKTIIIWSHDCKFIRSISLMDDSFVTSLVAIPANSQIVSAFINHKIFVWDATKTYVKTNDLPLSPVNIVCRFFFSLFL